MINRNLQGPPSLHCSVAVFGERIYDSPSFVIARRGHDPSIAPGTGTPSHGGFLYWETMELLQGLARRGEVVEIDLVEVAPAYDPSGVTSFLAAQVLLNLLGYIMAAGHEVIGTRGEGPGAA